jgi:DNA-binding response OmpR family regulator
MDDTPTVLLVAERDDELREFLVDQFLADRFAAHGAQSAEEARVKLAHFHPELRAFRDGSDDYLRKPIGYPLLLARVRALVRRSNGRVLPRRRIGALEVDQLQRRVTVAEQPVQVSRMEFEFLSRLATEPTRVYTKHELLREVWGFKAIGSILLP